MRGLRRAWTERRALDRACVTGCAVWVARAVAWGLGPDMYLRTDGVPLLFWDIHTGSVAPM